MNSIVSVDRYIEGFLAGQAVAYCERVLTGMSLAAQLDVPREHCPTICDLVRQEGCEALEDSDGEGRASIWIYRDDTVPVLIAQMKSAQLQGELGVWSMGRLLGYANADVSTFIRTR